MAEMTKEELVQEVLDRVLQSSTGVEDMETVTSLDGVKSLPAEKNGQMVNVPLELIGRPAKEAAVSAETAAKKAENAVIGLEEKTQAAINATSQATEAATRAEYAANMVESSTISAMNGATVRFSGFVADAHIEMSSSVQQGGRVVWVQSLKTFAYFLNNKYYSSWRAEGIPNPDMYMNGEVPHRNKLYIYNNSLYIATSNELSLYSHQHQILSESEYEALEYKDDTTIYMTYEEE